MSDYPMTEYIKEQPSALKRLTDNRKKISERFVKTFKEVNPDRIYLFGSGTSLNAANLAAPFMQKILNTEVSCFAASQITEAEIFSDNPMFCAVSQGGTSSNTIISCLENKLSPLIHLDSNSW